MSTDNQAIYWMKEPRLMNLGITCLACEQVGVLHLFISHFFLKQIEINVTDYRCIHRWCFHTEI
jgi:hypothetical protein